MKMLNGTVVHNATDRTSHIRLYFSENGEYSDNPIEHVDMRVCKGASKDAVIEQLLMLIERIGAL